MGLTISGRSRAARRWIARRQRSRPVCSVRAHAVLRAGAGSSPRRSVPYVASRRQMRVCESARSAPQARR